MYVYSLIYTRRTIKIISNQLNYRVKSFKLFNLGTRSPFSRLQHIFILWPTSAAIFLSQRIESYFTADNRDRQLSQVHLHVDLHAFVLGGVHWTVAVESERERVLDTVVGHHCMWTVSCNPLLNFRHSEVNNISD